MNEGRTVFSQVLDFVPRHTFRRRVQRYRGDYGVRHFTCWQQFLAMLFAQLTYRESLRDIEACLGAAPERLYHMGFTGPVSRSTLADANECRDWRIYADVAQVLIAEARKLYADEPLDVELDRTVYALDSSTVDLTLSLFPWASFRETKAAVKLHTLLDLRGNIPVFVWITDGRTHDVRVLDVLVPEPGSIYVLDRAYIDFERLWRLEEARAIFVTRAKKNLSYRRRSSSPCDRSSGLVCDQTIVLTATTTREHYPFPLRRIRYRDPESHKTFVFLTNEFALPALTIAALYRNRWQVELFFKWIKQHLRIKAFYGTSANAVKTQIWIAVSAYVVSVR
jgi:transposase